MSLKRGAASALDEPVPKKARDESAKYTTPDEEDEQDTARSSHYAQQSKLDPVYGQRSAFPGLDDEGDDLDYGDEPSDGIQYLRMVRSEARGIPTLLITPKARDASNVYDDATEEEGNQSGGYYYDGAYTAAPVTAADAVSAEPQSSGTQKAYYDSLLLRFSLIRATLKCTPPLSAIEQLSSSHPISFPSTSKKAYIEWGHTVHATDPHMTQMACLDMPSALMLIKLLTKLLPPAIRSRSSPRIDRMGAWTWAALGRCWEVGQLNSEEVGVLRDLGKIAAGALFGFKDRSGRTYGEEEEDESDAHDQSDGTKDEQPAIATMNESESANANNTAGYRPADEQAPDGDKEELEAAKKRLEEKILSHENGPESDMDDDSDDEDDGNKLDFETRARATLDMILTIVGELYGQRDLLVLRDEWAIDPLEAASVQ
ncbi:MAG: hypothetical protein Q9227_001141 [Pyrenula ochraceoflavens]